jgi:mono/diheme cytochrome c family protein
MPEALDRTSRTLLLIGCCAVGACFGATTTFAADAAKGMTLAKRWCSSCHVVESDPKRATDQVPTFVSIAKMPDFGSARLALLLLKPHPNMPSLSLSRAEIADIADYIATLK